MLVLDLSICFDKMNSPFILNSLHNIIISREKALHLSYIIPFVLIYSSNQAIKQSCDYFIPRFTISWAMNEASSSA